MSFPTRCVCGQVVVPPVDDAEQARCPQCGRFIAPIGARAHDSKKTAGAGPKEPEIFVATAVDAAAQRSDDRPTQPRPQTAPPPRRPEAPLARMLSALVDPRAINAMLVVGGGLAVLGLLIWLTSLGIFDNRWVLAAALGGGSLALLGAGWYVSLRTRHRLAGRALTFLATVVTPLNLSFYQAQGLVTVDHGLWACGVVCCLLFAATVYLMREPVFLYAVELGVTMTGVLLLGQLHWAGDLSCLSLFFVALAAASLLAGHTFAEESPVFSRRRFGAPLYWGAHAQLAAGLVLLAATQVIPRVELDEASVLLTTALHSGAVRLGVLSTAPLLAGVVWSVAAAIYVYASRRPGCGAMIYAATACLCAALAEVFLAAEITGVFVAPLFALLGLGVLIAGRLLGQRGQRGVDSGHGLLLIAMLSACWQALARVAVIDAPVAGWRGVAALAIAAAVGSAAMIVTNSAGWRHAFGFLTTVACGLAVVTITMLSDLTGWQKAEIASTNAGLIMLAAATIGRFNEDSVHPDDTVSLGLWLGSMLAIVPPLAAVVYHRILLGSLSPWDEMALIAIGALLAVSGTAWRVLSMTLWGAAALASYVVVILVSLGWREQLALGAYIGIGGAVLFVIGIALSVYRERLAQIPARMAKREGVFEVLTWR